MCPPYQREGSKVKQGSGSMSGGKREFGMWGPQEVKFSGGNILYWCRDQAVVGFGGREVAKRVYSWLRSVQEGEIR